jgi:hypothetical protein
MSHLRIVCSQPREKLDAWKETKKPSCEWPRPSPMRSNSLLVKVNLLVLRRPRLQGFVEAVVDELLKGA